MVTYIDYALPRALENFVPRAHFEWDEEVTFVGMFLSAKLGAGGQSIQLSYSISIGETVMFESQIQNFRVKINVRLTALIF